MTIRAADLDYVLPEALIAREPVVPREAARMLVATRGEDMVHARVADLWKYVGPGDVIVVNTTQSRPSRLRILNGDSATELIAVEPLSEREWVVRLPDSIGVDVGQTFRIDGSDDYVTIARHESGDCWVAKFSDSGESVEAILARSGEIPLPPYATRLPVAQERLLTEFGRDFGSAAPPTAGLHLSNNVLRQCEAAGARIAEVTLHVSLRTSRYRMVDLGNPQLHSEYFTVPTETLDLISGARRTVAIGTTVVRALEAYAMTGQQSGATSIFLSRGHEFRMIDALFTCFQAPRSTMLAMIDAFAGPSWKDVYDVAVAKHYRFLALGDACLFAGQRPRTFRS